MSANEWSLTARWVFPVDAPPLERGIVTIAGDRIAAVEAHGKRTADYDLGNAAILPGLVNAHTHLDLSGARGKIPPCEIFTDWLRRVIAYRRSCTPESIHHEIAAGIKESLQFGTTLLGDIAVGGASWDRVATQTLRAVVFYELLGLPKDRARMASRPAIWWWKAKHTASATCRAGLSPHAPFSFRAEFIPALALLGERVAIHLAESTAESEVLERHSGPFVTFLAERGVWDPTGLAWSPSHVIELTSDAKHALYIHCNYLDPTTLIPPQGTIVYCPRTHAAFGHPPHPFRKFLARGVRVALGTDSLASNPDLDVLAEARFVHAKHPDVAGDVLLRMVTLSGAEALGWADETGSLTPGKSADLIVLPLPKEEIRDPHDQILESTTAVRAVLFRGNWTRRPDEIRG
jgi:cytosine/adenosine deaminase-related metal-dependent hydrolase